jgi:tetratricopeptide (TPR) repeat protein
MPSPDDPLYKAGYQKLLAKDYIGALADFNQLVELNPSHWAYGGRALARQSLGDIKGAIEDNTVAFKMSSGLSYQFRRGMLRLQLKNLWDLCGGLQDIYFGIRDIWR